MSDRTCSVEECTQPLHAKSFCGSHYWRWKRYGDPEHVTVPPDRSTLPDSPMRYGLTYRQLDHWTRKGYIHADRDTPGSGNYRRWPDAEQRVAERMSRLIAAGFRVDAAAEVARAFVNETHEVAPGVYVSVYDRAAS